MDTEQNILTQQKQPATPKGPRGISSPVSTGVSLAATSAPTPSDSKKPGYYSENGYLMELSRQERRRIQQEINKRFKPGELHVLNSLMCIPTCIYRLGMYHRV